MAIRTRILFVVLALVFVTLFVLDAVSYTVVRSSLYSRADAQLQTAAPTFENRLVFLLSEDQGAQQPLTHSQLCDGLPAHSFGAFYLIERKDTGGYVAQRDNTASVSCSTANAPHLPAGFGARVQDAGGATVFGTLSSFRVMAQLVEVNHTVPFVFVVGEPVSLVTSTVRHALILEVVVSGSILLAAGALAFFLVQLGLRPLEDMADTAGEIAAGDLSRRVDDADERTEVGRLGSALNVMLSRIEQAFLSKEASEQQLRQFIADASHELRTPLTSIRGYAELFSRTRNGAREIDPVDLTAALRRIESESARMSGLVDDLLLLARLDQGRPLDQSAVDLRTVADDVAGDARMLAPGRVVTVSAAPEAASLGADFVAVGDEERLRQVVTNLVANALAHTPEGTPIEIVLSLVPARAAEVARVAGVARVADVADVAEAAERVRLAVVDHGPGVGAEAKGKVFDRFWRADESRDRGRGGNGLGLSIVAAVVAAHHGFVLVDDTAGGGATFVVDLPAYVDDEPVTGATRVVGGAGRAAPPPPPWPVADPSEPARSGAAWSPLPRPE